MPEPKVNPELIDFRLDAVETRTAKVEAGMLECKEAVIGLTASVKALVESNHELSGKLEKWAASSQRRVGTVEVEVAALKGAKTITTTTTTQGTSDLTPPTPGTPAYYLAVLLKYGGPAGALIAGAAVVIVGGIWALNRFGVI